MQDTRFFLMKTNFINLKCCIVVYKDQLILEQKYCSFFLNLYLSYILDL